MKVLLVFSCLLIVCIQLYTEAQSSRRSRASYKTTPPNILEILVDDLGYGDTSVFPFVGLNVKTPGLERMASKGTILTNYHTAAATCTPTRASILTGMYPWRMGIKAVFEYGERNSNRNDWLPPLPTIPMVLREANYSVFHSGKWHLGGMRNDDLDMRTLPVKPAGQAGGKRCPHPGPNQQGFKHYVSVLDGPGSPRQNRLQIDAHLYSQGCTALLHNDVDIGGGQYNITGFLSYCEAEHAIRAMDRSVARQKPFYIQLWFHAPHAPLEAIPGWPEYHKREVKVDPKTTRGAIAYKTMNSSLNNMGPTYKYRTMIADMDRQVGRLLKRIEDLGIESNTLVTFTADNGPENSAGTTAGFRGKKRSITEGGIRVPALVQWVGTIPAGQSSDMFAVSTDLFPTFLDAAGVRAPSHLRLDGLSWLPQLVPNYYERHAAPNAPGKRSLEPPLNAQPSPIITSPAADISASQEPTVVSAAPLLPPAPLAILPKRSTQHLVDEIKDDAELYRCAMRDRVTLWHNDYEGPRRTAAWIYDYKVMLDENNQMSEMFDMRSDKFENTNLLTQVPVTYWRELNTSLFSIARQVDALAPLKARMLKNITLEMVLQDRTDPDVHIWIASHMFKLLQDFAYGGNAAHAQYMKKHPGWRYSPTVLSDYRHDFIAAAKLTRFSGGKGAEDMRNALLNGSCGTTTCSCEVKVAHSVPSLPFESAEFAYLMPGKLLKGAQLLGLSEV